MKGSDSRKLDQIIIMLGDMVAAFGKRFDTIDDRFDKIDGTLADHTRRSSVIEGDVKTNLDKRLQLEVRTHKLEKHVGISNTGV